MDNFLLKTALLIGNKYDSVFKLEDADKYNKFPLYSDFYHYTSFGQSDVGPEILDILKKAGKKEGFIIGELFGGVGFESNYLNYFLPKNSYYSIDIGDYFKSHQKIKCVTYLKEDLINNTKGLSKKFDVLFCGVANASHSGILSLEDMNKHLCIIREALNKGGIFVMSFNPDNLREPIAESYISTKIIYGANSSQNLTSKEIILGISDKYNEVRYVDAAVLVDKNNLAIKMWWADDTRIKKWEYDLVISMAENNGLRYISDLSNIFAGILAFVKK